MPLSLCPWDGKLAPSPSWNIIGDQGRPYHTSRSPTLLACQDMSRRDTIRSPPSTRKVPGRAGPVAGATSHSRWAGTPVASGWRQTRGVVPTVSSIRTSSACRGPLLGRFDGEPGPRSDGQRLVGHRFYPTPLPDNRAMAWRKYHGVEKG